MIFLEKLAWDVIYCARALIWSENGTLVWETNVFEKLLRSSIRWSSYSLLLELLNFVDSGKIDTSIIKNYHQSIWDINTNIGYKDMTEVQYWSSTHNNTNGGEFVLSFDSGIVDTMIPVAPRFVRLVRDRI